ncbi:MAG: twin-arginine translocase TatA/TatE family subunit [Bacteroidaceae bacterium]|nr:twin-arginine translocase TatA/TatE family subunit [Bacteroidaceae bacterium]
MDTSLLLFLNLGTGEIIIIALIVLLLFGGRKIPELMRGLGKGVKSFKQGMNDIENIADDKTDEPPSDNTKSAGDNATITDVKQ